MTKHLRKFYKFLIDSFGLISGLMVVAGILMGVVLVHVDGYGPVPCSLLVSAWLYNGEKTGARTLLGVVASSTIGVAGTVFSITIAALSLAEARWDLNSFVTSRVTEATKRPSAPF